MRTAPRWISIHALREEGDKEIYLSGTTTDISIHALREEGDKVATTVTPTIRRFLSTPSARRATSDSVIDEVDDEISIHALREEGDHT